MDLLSPGLRPELLRSLLAQLPLAGAVAASSVDHVRAPQLGSSQASLSR